MRKKNYKGRCEKQSLEKFTTICKTYEPLQAAYANILAKSKNVVEARYPSFTQFRYYFRKTRDKKKEYISRDGLKNYQRNNRPLLGDGVREYAPAPGVGMIDSTVADVYILIIEPLQMTSSHPTRQSQTWSS